MKHLIFQLKKAWSLWDGFWFAPQNLLGLAFMRIVLCGTLLYMSFMRFFNLEFFTDKSWVSKSNALLILPELGRPGFAWNFWPDSANSPMLTVLVVLFALLTVGVGGRLLMALAWVINIGFIYRNYPVNFGADIIGSLFLFYMIFTNSCERLSVLNLFREKKSFKSSDALSSMMIRMMQVQIMAIYAYTGWEKLKGASWWDGTALWSVLANPQMTTMDFSFLREIPWVIPVLGYTTILFEVYFPPMVIWHKSRHIWLFMGLMMHLGIGIFMGLMPFATVMLSTYFLFLNSVALEQKIVSKLDFSRN
ncbi:HTTM domain-containing protein [Bdellovibrio sp. HCB290]|uniref:HTTM domain-containing protein n=1 Tax=Bdellovibrio sp. HCB290 TaxID=3394356 RepID=UPI0039B40D87